MRSRVSSPSAAKTVAVSATRTSAAEGLERTIVLAFSRDVPLDQPALNLPALRIRRERLRTLLERYRVESGFRDRQHHAAVRFLELERHERHRLLKRIAVGLDLVRMPPEREEPLRLDSLDDDDELDAGVGLLRLRDVRVHLRRHEFAGQRTSGSEVAGELDAEPCAELPSFRDRTPNALEARAEPYLLLDAIGEVCH